MGEPVYANQLTWWDLTQQQLTPAQQSAGVLNSLPEG